MRKLSGLGLICAVAVFFIQCRSTENGTPSAVVVKEHILTRISSGSGLSIVKDSAFIISDDAPFFGKIALKNQNLQLISIKGSGPYASRVPRTFKPDYEASLIGPMDGRDYLFAFGSGSQSPERDSLLFFPIADPGAQQKVSLKPFYRRIQQFIYKPEAHWNLEGATKMNDSLMLFNRGNNTVMNISWNQFTSFVMGVADALPFVSYRRVRMPVLQGYEARFSGACTLNDQYILVSASVEATHDWSVDGPVLGSFIGLIDRNSYQVKAIHQVTAQGGKPYIHKIESLEVLEKEKGGTLLLAGLVDDDDGKTRYIQVRFREAL